MYIIDDFKVLAKKQPKKTKVKLLANMETIHVSTHTRTHAQKTNKQKTTEKKPTAKQLLLITSKSSLGYNGPQQKAFCES
jgi:hypothetical protein